MQTIQPGKLTLACADLDARPLFWTDSNRRRHGYEPALADLLASRLGCELEWRFLQWADFAPALAAGEVDAIWCGAAITPERERAFLFSRPYAVFDESVLVRSGEGLRTSADLVGKRVGAIDGSTNLALAKQWPGCEPVPFDGAVDDVFADMIAALVEGRVDAVVDDEPAFGRQREDPAFEIAFTVQTANRWGAALDRDNQALKNALDTGLASLAADGSLRDCWRHWLDWIAYPETLG